MSFWFLLAALMGPRFFARLLFFGLRMGLFLSCFLRSVATLRARTRKGEHPRI
jgi:hypothetical protein